MVAELCQFERKVNTMIAKARKQGNTVPAEFKIKENAEYQLHKNIFDQNPDYDLKKAIKEMNLSDNGKLVGKESVW